MYKPCSQRAALLLTICLISDTSLPAIASHLGPSSVAYHSAGKTIPLFQGQALLLKMAFTGRQSHVLPTVVRTLRNGGGLRTHIPVLGKKTLSFKSTFLRSIDAFKFGFLYGPLLLLGSVGGFDPGNMLPPSQQPATSPLGEEPYYVIPEFDLGDIDYEVIDQNISDRYPLYEDRIHQVSVGKNVISIGLLRSERPGKAGPIELYSTVGGLEKREWIPRGSKQRGLGPWDDYQSHALSSDGKFLATLNSDSHKLVLWNITNTPQQVYTFHLHNNNPNLQFTFSPDGKYLVLTSDIESDAALQALGATDLYTLISTYKLLEVLENAKPEPNKYIHLYPLKGPGKFESPRIFNGHSKEITQVAFSHDGKTLLSAAEDGNIILWDVATGSIKKTISGFSDWVIAADFSPDDKTIAIADRSNVLRFYSTLTGELLESWQLDFFPKPHSVAYSPDGTRLLVLENYLEKDLVNADPRTWVFDVRKRIAVLEAHGWTHAAAYLPNGNLVIGGKKIGSYDHSAFYYDTTLTVQERLSPGDTEKNVTPPTINPDDPVRGTTRHVPALPPSPHPPTRPSDQQMRTSA